MAEIARKRNQENPLVAARSRLHYFEGPARAAVIAVNEFMRPSAQAIQYPTGSRNPLGWDAFLIVERDGNGQPELLAHRIFGEAKSHYGKMCQIVNSALGASGIILNHPFQSK